MAGDWIKMRDNLWDDPRVAKIVDMTDSSEASVIGALYWLWATADQHTEDGIMTGLTLRSIDRKTGVKGFADALCSVNWLADHPEGVRIVDFESHNGTSAKKRCQTAKRVANHASANAPKQNPAKPTNAPSVSDALAREREEKRREEEKTRAVASEAVFDQQSPARAFPEDQIFDELGDIPGNPAMAAEVIAPSAPSMAAAVCIALKAIGIAAVNPSHPELTALLDNGADIGMFVYAAHDSVKKGKGFNYLLAAVKGQIADAKNIAGRAGVAAVAPTETNFQRSMRLRYEEATGTSQNINVIDITPTNTLEIAS